MSKYANKFTGEVLPFKTQWTQNPNEGLVSEFGETKTVSTDYEPIRKLVNRVKHGEIHLLSRFLDEFTDDERKRDNDTLPLDVTSPEELYEDVTDTDSVVEYTKVLTAETSGRSAGNPEAHKEPVQTDLEDYIRENGQASDNGARADDVASVGS